MVDSNDPAMEGSSLAYNITVTNNTLGNATNITVTDQLPVNATFLLASSGCGYSSGTVTCSIGNLSAGASTSVQLLVTPTHAAVGTMLSNTASATAAEGDPTMAKTATESTLIIAATYSPMQIFFDAMNNVGFGTTNPIFNDDGVTGANVGKYFAIDGVVPGGAAYLGIGGDVPGIYDRVGCLNFYNRSVLTPDSRNAVICSFNDGAGPGKGDLRFYTAPDTVGPRLRVAIGSAGTIGINRPHPLGALVNLGPGPGGAIGAVISAIDANDTQIFSLRNSGTLAVHAAGEGIILKSPDGLVCTKLTISNSGALVTTIVTCP